MCYGGMFPNVDLANDDQLLTHWKLRLSEGRNLGEPLTDLIRAMCLWKCAAATLSFLN